MPPWLDSVHTYNDRILKGHMPSASGEVSSWVMVELATHILKFIWWGGGEEAWVVKKGDIRFSLPGMKIYHKSRIIQIV